MANSESIHITPIEVLCLYPRSLLDWANLSTAFSETCYEVTDSNLIGS